MEDVVVDVQCGFRSGHGCSYCYGLLCMSIGGEGHKTQHQGFLLFVDLQKAYNIILYPDQLAVWLVLQKYGILG